MIVYLSLIEQVNVMFQAPSHKVAHHQNTEIQHLTFENQLLIQRNKLLGQENQRILQELQACNERLQDDTFQKAERIKSDLKIITKVAQEQMSAISKNMSRDLKKSMLPILSQLSKENIDGIDVRILFNGLINTIKSLSQCYSALKNDKTRIKLEEKEERLYLRKTAREKSDKILHIVKEPAQSMQDLSPKTLFYELKHQRQFFEKIIKKVKKESLSMSIIKKVCNSHQESNKIRWALKGEQAELTLLERQFELGWIQPFTLEQTINKIKQLSEDMTRIRKDIEDQLLLL